MIGTMLGRYRVLEKIGEGAMGVVYKGEDAKLLRTVALKCLRDRGDDSEEVRARFEREAQAAASLDHANICPVYELGEENGQMFLAMAFIEGYPLSSVRAAFQASLYHTLRIAIQIGEGLRAAHQKGIIHRDIKGENILITLDGDARITDFGLALIRDRTRLTQPGAIMGTITHMSPEQALAKPTDRRTDIWSLGVVLYELAEGRLPFKAGNMQNTIAQLAFGEFPPLKTVRQPARKELERILRKALAKDPAERYQHVDDFVVDLRAVMAQIPPDRLQLAAPAANYSSEDPTMTIAGPLTAAPVKPGGSRILIFSYAIAIGLLVVAIVYALR